jgi:hypothetical protein
MLRARISAVLIVAGLLLPALMGCILPDTAHAQSMECCAQMTCPEGGQGQICLSASPPAGDTRSLPELRASLGAPTTTEVALLPILMFHSVIASSASSIETPEQTPPDLYTLHLSLLI